MFLCAITEDEARRHPSPSVTEGSQGGNHRKSVATSGALECFCEPAATACPQWLGARPLAAATVNGVSRVTKGPSLFASVLKS